MMGRRCVFTVSLPMAAIVLALTVSHAAGQGQNVRLVGQIGSACGVARSRSDSKSQREVWTAGERERSGLRETVSLVLCLKSRIGLSRQSGAWRECEWGARTLNSETARGTCVRSETVMR